MIISLIHWNNNYIPAMEAFIGSKIYECKTREEAMKLLPDAEIIITIGGGDFAIHLDEEMVNVAKKLRWIFSVSAGIEKLPLKALHQQGVLINNSKGVHAVSIAEYVISNMLSLELDAYRIYENQKLKQWDTKVNIDALEDKTLVVIGAGSIGQEIGRKAKAFDMKVIGLKRTPDVLPYFDEVWGIEKLHEILPQGDYIVVITPLTKETYHLIDRVELGLMKSSAVLINASRGDTINEHALIDVLRDEGIRGAVLDVFHEEPLPVHNPLWDLPNVIITPHRAGVSKNVFRKVLKLFKENYERYNNKEDLINLIKENQEY